MISAIAAHVPTMSNARILRGIPSVRTTGRTVSVVVRNTELLLKNVSVGVCEWTMDDPGEFMDGEQKNLFIAIKAAEGNDNV